MVDIKELDAGHSYQLPVFDRSPSSVIFGPDQFLYFAKRVGANYPGNMSAYPGTNLQSVLRACLWRLEYLDHQRWSHFNMCVAWCLMWALWWLEVRAARQHGRWYWHGPSFALTAPMCPTCGHTDCREHKQ